MTISSFETSSIGTAPFVQGQVFSSHASLTSLQGHVKRAFDFMFSLTCGVMILPLLGLIAIWIKLDSTGPVLYKQKRVGLNGQEFWMYKFRSMAIGAEAQQAELLHLNEMDGPLFKIKEDPRVTSAGRFIRRASLDEFPQLINVIKGEMSLVGPRPPLPSEVAQFERWQMEKFVARPGMTGLWQVSGRNEISAFHQMIKLDIEYIRTWSLGLDIKLLFKTFRVVFQCLGAH